MAASATEPILFTGSPDALEAIVPVPSATRRSIRVVSEGDDVPFRALTMPVGADATLVRVVLGTTTAPGEYRARITADGGEFPAIITVIPQPHVSVHPSTLAFDCAPGDVAQMAVTIQNTGNTTVSPRTAYAVGLLEDGSLDTAVTQALLPRTREAGESRFERAGDALADRFAGLARLVVSGLDGPIEPGSTGIATVELRLDERARGGRRYHGLWRFEASKIPVSVTTPGHADQETPTSAPIPEDSP